MYRNDDFTVDCTSTGDVNLELKQDFSALHKYQVYQSFLQMTSRDGVAISVSQVQILQELAAASLPRNIKLQNDLEEVKVLLEKATRKRVRDTLTAEKSKIETEIKNKVQQKSQKKPEFLDNEKPAAVVAPITTGYTVKISNYGWDQSDKFVKIYITLTGVHQVPAENVQVHFTERSFDLLVKNLNGKSYSMIVNNLLKPISVEGSSKKVKTDTVLILCRKKAENTQWEYLTQVEKECKEKEKPSYDAETDPSEGLMNVLKKIYEDGDDDMKRTINKAWVESREKQAKGDTEF
ncbi:Calcyclin-binding protein [Fukomys damarensis]|uniref:Calcyclin-binding protein n=1 Tax=Fukomys damarensis TaxID=885580 RepID=A0A091DEU9_FUKDA|nr:Calcyclin-binding protein [Fukomys damarensis]